uniref:CAZy families GT2 protein n=1 Tax=uncultured Alkalilimnicola sp. TaxID=543110 RepID=A0A060BTT3_9GAMM|nr:CAZy families GT2 protein [uncultured Alkalilimnicola sp.]
MRPAVFPEIALMEDIALSKRLKALSPPLCLAARAVTSGRRWRQHGIVRTILLMWRLRFAYWRGADPARSPGNTAMPRPLTPCASPFSPRRRCRGAPRRG